MANEKQIFGLVERDISRGVYLGKIIGFPHVEFEALTLEEIVTKLQAHAVQLVSSGSLVLESEFVGVVRL